MSIRVKGKGLGPLYRVGGAMFLFSAATLANAAAEINYSGIVSPAPSLGITDWVVNSSGVNVGNKGFGDLNVLGGATVNINYGFSNFDLRKASLNDVGSIGTNHITIDGVGSSVLARVGAFGSKGASTFLVISGGGKLKFSGDGGNGGVNLYCGDCYTSGSKGSVSVVVTGAGSLLETLDLKLGASSGVGFDSSAVLAITDGGRVQSRDVYIGSAADSVSAMVSGAGSIWSAEQLQLSGGTFTVSDGGVVEADELQIVGVGGVSMVNIGSAPDQVLKKAGNLNVGQVVFGDPGASAPLSNKVLNFNHLDSTVFGAEVSGVGIINQMAGTTIVTGNSPGFQGRVNILGGVLQLGDGVTSGNLGPVASYSVGSQGELSLGGFDATLNTLSNAGTVNFGGLGANTLTISSDYEGSGGLLVFNSVLGGDDARTDKLVVNGDTSGSTRVSVNNLGGSGASTLHGMELISVGGNSAGDFTQQGRIAAGAYDYSLMRGAGADANNWYLSSSLTPPVIPPVDPPVTPPVDPGPSSSGTPILRPEAGGYIGNIAATNSMFTTNLDDRLGETEYTDAATGEQKLTNLWVRTSGGRNRSEDSSGQLKTKANRYSVMLGGDFAVGSTGNGGTWRLGGLAGYGNDHNTSTSEITGYRAKGEVDGYTTGLYGTWYANGAEEAGLYADTVLQYSWFNNSVKGDDLASESYKSKGLSATFESGYVVDLGKIAGNSYFLQPKAKFAWSGIRADDYTEQNGTRVVATGNDNLRSTLGVKAFMKGYTAQRDGKQQSFKPYVEMNWIHNSEDYGVRMDGVDVSQEGSRNIAEFRVGVEGHVLPQLNVTTSLTQQLGSNSWSDTAGMLGLEYSF